MVFRRVGLLAVAATLLAPAGAWAGDGTFATEPVGSPYGTGTFPASVAVADFDNDGDHDLAIVNTNSANVTIRLGAGDGTFSTQGAGSPFAPASAPGGNAFGPLPRGVAVGDFNEDGNEDLAITNAGDDEIAIHLGGGNGAFGAGTFYSSCDGPTTVVIGDFDLDANEDLATACINSDNAADVDVYTGNGDGTFDTAVPMTTGTQPNALAVADFDGDGDEDLAVLHAGSPGLKVFPGAAGATFGAGVAVSGGGSGPAQSGTPLAAGDFNSDDNDDLTLPGIVSMGAGDGTFTASFQFSAGLASSVAVGDYNSDGNEDLAIPGLQANTVSIRLGAGDGTFPTEPPGSPFAAGVSPQAVAIGDFNGDRNEDLAVTDVNNNTVTVRLGGGSPWSSGNLLTNGGAEGSGLARTLAAQPAVPGWTTASGTLTYARYSVPGLPQYLDAARWEGGLGLFTGGPGAADSSATQVVDVSASAAAIDTGSEGIRLAALLGGRGASNDRMRVTASFRNAGAAEIGTTSIGPVTAADRRNRTELLPRAVTASIPVGTRSILVTLTATHADGAYNDALADNVRLTFAASGPPPDGDGDGVPDAFDNCPATANPGQANNDGDMQGDACDPDDDNDGVPDAVPDNCQFVSNAVQADTDGDGQGDACDADDDNDGVADGSDNCAAVANAGQADTDSDGQGDACDADDDGDGVPDGSDGCPLVAGTGADGCAPAGPTGPGGPAGPGAPAGPTSSKRALTLAYAAKSGRFKGTLTADVAGCASGQRVDVFEKVKGPDTNLGTATTKGNGKFRLKQAAGSGKYYAMAPASSASGAGCLAARSKRLKLK